MCHKFLRCGAKPESGQAMLFTVLGLGLFLIGAMAFAIDLSNLWFRRQAAQTAADAACTAGAMDLLVDANNSVTNQGGFETKSGASGDANPFTCGNLSKSNQTPAPCAYAANNGFPGTLSQSQFNAGTLGNYVNFSWSPVATAPPGVSTPDSTVIPTAFLQVQVNSNMPTFFAGMLRGKTGQSIAAKAVCGVAEAAAPIPIVVLDPVSPPNATPAQSALNVQGTPDIKIFGGPQRSIQVDSLASTSSCGSSNCSVNNPWGTATIDLSKGGPSGTGSDIGLSGSPSAPTANMTYLGGTTGHWIAPASPIGDPFAQVCYPGQSGCTYQIDGNSVPSVPTGVYVPGDLTSTNAPGCSPVTQAKILGGNCVVNHLTHGCPDTTCVLFTPGDYTSTINIHGGGGTTAIFDPGLYYMDGDLQLGSGSLARPGTGDAGNTADGITFYFHGNHTLSVTADSGSRTVDPFNSLKGPGIDNGAGSVTPYTLTHNAYTLGLQCLSTSAVPQNLQGVGTPAPGVNLQGNILIGPCTGYYGDPLGASEPTPASTPPGPGEQRWFLFFQDRSATGNPAGKGVQPLYNGSGAFTMAGAMYFHACNASGTGLNCGSPSTYYSDIFTLSGGSGSNTYVLGEIVTDNLTLGGNSTINMDLNPTTAFTTRKASLYQ